MLSKINLYLFNYIKKEKHFLSFMVFHNFIKIKINNKKVKKKKKKKKKIKKKKKKKKKGINSL